MVTTRVSTLSTNNKGDTRSIWKVEKMNKIYTATLIEDPDNPEECILPFPPEMLEIVGWKEGDTLNWIDNKDGTWLLKKVDTNRE